MRGWNARNLSVSDTVGGLGNATRPSHVSLYTSSLPNERVRSKFQLVRVPRGRSPKAVRRPAGRQR